jgi:hypothetical protein
MTAAGAAFNLTGRFKEAVTLINATEPEKFTLFLGRVMCGLLDEDAAFTPAEREKLPQALLGGGGTADQVDALLDGCTFIFEQTAYRAFPPAALGEKLFAAGLDQAHAAAFAEAWTASGQAVLERLRAAPLAPLALEQFNWRLHIQLAQQETSKINAPTAIFQFVLNDAEPVVDVGNSGVGGQSKAKAKTKTKQQQQRSFVAEMNKEELTTFYRQIERIQDQLDTLS